MIHICGANSAFFKFIGNCIERLDKVYDVFYYILCRSYFYAMYRMSRGIVYRMPDLIKCLQHKQQMEIHTELIYICSPNSNLD